MDVLKQLYRIWLIGLILGLIASVFFPVSPWMIAAIVGTMPIVGWIITIDDELPGGFFNADGDDPFPVKEFMICIIFALCAWLVYGFTELRAVP